MKEEQRVILHSDLNAFFASVETVLHPEYRGLAIAVCGNEEDRHGIVLAKSEPAKKAGVVTGMTCGEAKMKCPGLVIVPTHYEQYAAFSRKVRAIYERYTDLVEPFGMDECWLDVTGSARLFGSGERIAEDIRKTVKEELGLTVSVGVSFNKVFAKLASDLKKPDAVTVLPKESFRETVFPLPVSALLYAGRTTVRKLNQWGIRTIGDLAAGDPALLKELLGINGYHLWVYANGLDSSPVMRKDYEPPLKSMSRGITCVKDLQDGETASRVILLLSQTFGRRLREQKQQALGIELFVKQNNLLCERYSAKFREPTQSPSVIAAAARKLLYSNYHWNRPIRALTVAVTPLCPEDQPFQPDFFRDEAAILRRQQIDGAVDVLRRRFGEQAILPAELLIPMPIPKDWDRDTELPGMMYR